MPSRYFNSMEGPSGFLNRVLRSGVDLVPGIVAASVVGLAAAFIAREYGGPIMLFVLLLGMALNPVADHERLLPGIDCAAHFVLRLGVALLGVRITLDQIISLGLMPLVVVVSGVVATIFVGVVLSRWFKLGTRFGILTGSAVAICGASAAMAISAVLPKGKNDERDTIFTVIGVTTLSTIAMIVYPIITLLLGYDDHQAGIFLGGTIHDVAQVIGAGYSISQEAGDTATFTKLLRVAMLLPVALSVAFLFLPGKGGSEKVRPPLFLFAFFILAGINSAGWIPPDFQQGLSQLSRVCLVLAIAALGIRTSLAGVMKVGGTAITLIVLETFFLAGLVIALLTVASWQ